MPDRYRYFRIEAQELLEQLQLGVLGLEKGESQKTVVPRLLRNAHTLKGAARVVRQVEVADLAHAVEDLLVPLRDEQQTVTSALINQLLEAVDAIRLLLAQLDQATSPQTLPAAVDTPPLLKVVRADAMELETATNALGELGALLEKLSDQVTALGGSTANDGRGAAEVARTVEREVVTLLQRAQRELGQLGDVIERLRLVPADRMWSSLERTARDTAQSLGKRVAIQFIGGNLRLDLDLAEQAERVLVQAIRNAVAHGIEPVEGRSSRGKKLEGQITVRLDRRGREISFSCSDDGRGFALDPIRAAAGKLGREGANLQNEGELLDVLLQGGISTADAVTSASGRGVGFDLIRDVAEKCGGRLELKTAIGQGSTLIFSVPASAASLDAVLVQADEQIWGFPLACVERTVNLKSSQIIRGRAGDSMLLEGQRLPFVLLRSLLSRPFPIHDFDKAWPTLIIEASGRRAAIAVDRLLGTQNVLARALPRLAAVDRVISAGWLASDGTPYLLLDPEVVVERAMTHVGAPVQPGLQQRVILVVDDSLTTRMLEQSILESAGYEVDLATSGEEGLEMLRSGRYSLVLVDVEMPGIDGFAFVRTMSRDDRFRKIPAILVTSRDATEDVAKGIEAGAAGYIVKSDFNQIRLLARIEELIG